jgi:hypothetical protein
MHTYITLCTYTSFYEYIYKFVDYHMHIMSRGLQFNTYFFIGMSSLSIVIYELQHSLTEGYQRHVCNYTIRYICMYLCGYLYVLNTFIQIDVYIYNMCICIHPYIFKLNFSIQVNITRY